MKLLTLNIEGHKHLDLVRGLLAKEQPEVICLQEVFQKDLPQLLSSLPDSDQYSSFFVANTEVKVVNQYKIEPFGMWGNLLVIRKSYIADDNHDFHSYFYVGETGIVPEFTGPHSPRRSLLVAQMNVGHQSLAVATTHFTWTPNGLTSPQQQRDVKKLKLLLNNYKSFILCGDFNAPRGGEIYTHLVDGLVDHLPDDIVTTLDHQFHYAGVLNLVVDGVLSTPEISSIKTRVIDGVSDHKAIVVEFALH